MRPEGGTLDLARGDDQLLAEQDVLGDELPTGPAYVGNEPGEQGQGPGGLAQRGLGAVDHGGDGGSKAASEGREHGPDLAQDDGSYKLVESEMMSDPTADENASQDR